MASDVISSSKDIFNYPQPKRNLGNIYLLLYIYTDIFVIFLHVIWNVSIVLAC